jgi:hypothetical protein
MKINGQSSLGKTQIGEAQGWRKEDERVGGDAGPPRLSSSRWGTCR